MRHLVCNNEIPNVESSAFGHDGAPVPDVYRNTFGNGTSTESARIEDKIKAETRFCSFEIIPVPGQDHKIYERLLLELELCSPLFYSVAWHGDVPIENHPSLKLNDQLSNLTLLHLAARGLTRQNVRHVLNRALDCGKTNIFALQGDSTESDNISNGDDFLFAIDLVKFIRAEYGSKFSICVAGYPQMHPQSPSKKADLFYLKAKVDSGANFVITQLIFEAKVFIEFVKDCRNIGIMVPIIAGIFPVPSFNSLIKMTQICRVMVPDKWLRDLQPIKDDDAAVQEYGIQSATRIIDEILASGMTNGIHMFTLNRSHLAVEICKRAGLWKS